MYCEDKIVYKPYKDPVKYTESIIKCANCERDLVSVIEYIDKKLESQHIFLCPCGGQSFKKKYENMVVFKPINLYIVNASCLNNINQIKLGAKI